MGSSMASKNSATLRRLSLRRSLDALARDTSGFGWMDGSATAMDGIRMSN
ncbi:conserved hypothetical protein [Ricinus communis]|uniref:Uncharacterized protein n=1 Tax=Ricinus communis TaxID=3988 RepID=B9SGN8_RICCO|nr:conserved hypothetical protein [Ricinus communis]